MTPFLKRRKGDYQVKSTSHLDRLYAEAKLGRFVLGMRWRAQPDAGDDWVCIPRSHFERLERQMDRVKGGE
jgi:hypothetical protein